jgi:putative ABC transport system permease protein
VTRAAKLVAWLFLRGWRRHPIRVALNVVSIALGVALFLSTGLVMTSIGAAVERAASAVDLGVDLVVTRDAAGLADAERAALSARPEFAGASGVVQVNAVAPDGTTLVLLGVDPVADARVRTLHAAVRFAEGGPLRFAADPQSLLLTEAGLAHLRATLGDRLTLTTAHGRRDFTIAGALDPLGPPAVKDALRDHGFLLLSSAQRLFGREGKVDRVELRLAPGVSLEAGERAAREVVRGAMFTTPGEATRDSLRGLDGVRTILVLNSLLALLVAVFFVYNTVSASVAERTRDVGLLRSIGLTRLGLCALLAGEAAACGLLGLGLGALFGVGLARATLGSMARAIGTLYLLVPPVTGLRPSAIDLAEAGALAVGVAVVAALLAAWGLARRKPLEILRPALSGAVARSRIVRVAAIGVALFAATTLLVVVSPRVEGFSVARWSAILLPAGLALAAPAAVLAVAGGLRRVLAPRTRPPTWLALDAARAHPARTATTIMAFGLSLGLVIGQGSISSAMIETTSTWLVGTIPGDVIVGANSASPVSLFPFSEEAIEPLRRIPGVADVFRVRWATIHSGGRKVVCFALDVAASVGRSRHDFVEGDPDDAHRRCAAGEAVWIADNLSWMTGLHVGDRIAIDGIDGTVELPIAGVLHDYNSYLGTVFVDLSLYRRLFRDPLLDFAELCLDRERPPDVDAVAAAARAALPPEYDFLRVTQKSDFVAQILGVVSDLNQLSIVQMALAIVIGSIGIVVTVTLSVLSRARELALLRAIGMDARDRRRTVVLEVVGLASASAVLGVAIGNVVFVPGDLLFREIAGFTFGYRFSLAHTLLAIGVALGTAVVASIGALLARREPLARARSS